MYLECLTLTNSTFRSLGHYMRCGARLTVWCQTRTVYILSVKAKQTCSIDTVVHEDHAVCSEGIKDVPAQGLPLFPDKEWS